jgi:molybdopterin/thiamine biosynthesis adenylyltransferase
MNNKVLDSKNEKPIFFKLDTESGRDSFSLFKKNNSDILYIDTLSEQINELNLVRNPSLINHESLNNSNLENVSDEKGVWVFFPWRNICVRILDKDEYKELRLSRNKNLIKEEEQIILDNKILAIVGLNVGNPGAVAIALEGVSNHFKLADLDPLSVSNLNRFRAGLPDLGINKATITTRQIYEINPYAEIELFEDGITNENCEDYLVKPKVDLLIEEMDNLKLKLEIRDYARINKIPVLMVTGNGENVLVDVERYDLDDNLPILSGFLEESVISKIKNMRPKEGSYEDRIRLAQDFMGEKYLDNRLVESFSLILDKKIASIPQLAESSFLRGAVLCHFAKKILLSDKIDSGRYSVSLDGQMIKL